MLEERDQFFPHVPLILCRLRIAEYRDRNTSLFARANQDILDARALRHAVRRLQLGGVGMHVEDCGQTTARSTSSRLRVGRRVEIEQLVQLPLLLYLVERERGRLVQRHAPAAPAGVLRTGCAVRIWTPVHRALVGDRCRPLHALLFDFHCPQGNGNGFVGVPEVFAPVLQLVLHEQPHGGAAQQRVSALLRRPVDGRNQLRLEAKGVQRRPSLRARDDGRGERHNRAKGRHVAVVGELLWAQRRGHPDGGRVVVDQKEILGASVCLRHFQAAGEDDKEGVPVPQAGQQVLLRRGEILQEVCVLRARVDLGPRGGAEPHRLVQYVIEQDSRLGYTFESYRRRDGRAQMRGHARRVAAVQERRQAEPRVHGHQVSLHHFHRRRRIVAEGAEQLPAFQDVHTRRLLIVEQKLQARVQDARQQRDRRPVARLPPPQRRNGLSVLCVDKRRPDRRRRAPLAGAEVLVQAAHGEDGVPDDGLRDAQPQDQAAPKLGIHNVAEDGRRLAAVVVKGAAALGRFEIQGRAEPQQAARGVGGRRAADVAFTCAARPDTAQARRLGLVAFDFANSEANGQ